MFFEKNPEPSVFQVVRNGKNRAIENFKIASRKRALPKPLGHNEDFRNCPQKNQPAASSKKTPRVSGGEKDLIYSRSNIDLKTVSKITSIFGSNFDGFWTDFGSFSAPKIDQNRYQFRNRFLERAKKRLWDRQVRHHHLTRRRLDPHTPP